MPTSAKSVANIDAKIDSPGLKTNGGMAVQPCCMLQTLALFRMLKKPFDVKRSPDSKYSSLMNVARREVHEFSIFKHQKAINP